MVIVFSCNNITLIMHLWLRNLLIMLYFLTPVQGILNGTLIQLTGCVQN
jgi:hypothetical protein